MPSAHKHTCPHGSWTCHADDCQDGRGFCGTCAKLTRHDARPDAPIHPVLCTACDQPAMQPFGVVQVVPLCASCYDKISEQLRKGKFLG